MDHPSVGSSTGTPMSYVSQSTEAICHCDYSGAMEEAATRDGY